MDGQILAKAILVLLLCPVICSNGAVIPRTTSPPDTSCLPEINVKRHSALRVEEMSSITLKCPVKHCGNKPILTWCKFMYADKCIQLFASPNVEIRQEEMDENFIMFSMEIKHITKNYSGEYRCQLPPLILGHAITVTVVKVGETENTTNNTPSYPTDTTNDQSKVALLPYVVICVSIVTIVGLVMLISFLSLHGCKRSSRSYATEAKGTSQAKKTEHTVQDQCPTRRQSGHITPSPIVPKRDRSLRLHPTQNPALRHHLGHDPSLNGTSLQGLLTLPRAPASTHSDADPRSATMPNGSPGNASDRRPSQVLYATLDHLAPKDNSRTQPPKFHPGEEFSEYASIRVS